MADPDRLGEPLPLAHDEFTRNGHAVECRVYAEDPENDFLPVTGNILKWSPYENQYVRYDSGIEDDSIIDVYYDPMIAKVIAWGRDRQEALDRMTYALRRTVLFGLKTNKQYLDAILNHDNFRSGSFDTHFIDTHGKDLTPSVREECPPDILKAACLFSMEERQGQKTALPSSIPAGWRNNYYQPQLIKFGWRNTESELKYEIHEKGIHIISGEEKTPVKLLRKDGDIYEIRIGAVVRKFSMIRNGDVIHIHNPALGLHNVSILPKVPDPTEETVAGGYKAPMPGEIFKVNVEEGDEVEAGQNLLIMVSMKMENAIEAHANGTVEEIYVQEGSFVEAETLLIKIKEEE